MAGRKFISPSALDLTSSDTNTSAPRLSVIAFSDHAKVRISMAGTMALNPSGTQDMHSPNRITLRTM